MPLQKQRCTNCRRLEEVCLDAPRPQPWPFLVVIERLLRVSKRAHTAEDIFLTCQVQKTPGCDESRNLATSAPFTDIGPIFSPPKMCSRMPRQHDTKPPRHRSKNIVYLEVSINGGTPKSSIYRLVFHYKPSILGYRHLWKPTSDFLLCFPKITFFSSQRRWSTHGPFFSSPGQTLQPGVHPEVK